MNAYATVAVCLVTACVLATWAAYWLTRSFKALSNRTSRIASLICPAIFAVLFAAISGTVLGDLGVNVESLQGAPEKTTTAIFFAIAILLLIPTMLISLLAGSMFKPGSNRKSDS